MLRESIFPLMVGISLLAHGGMAVWISRFEPPRRIAPEQGRASIRLRASVASTPAPRQPIATPQPADVPEIPRLAPAEIPIPAFLSPLPEAVLVPVSAVRPSPPQPSPEAVKPPPTPEVPNETDLEVPEVAVVEPAQAPSEASPESAAARGAKVDELPRKDPANPAPPYPADALAARLEGVVKLRVKIGVDGSVVAIRVHNSSNVASLDQSALDTVRHWRYHPALRKGTPIPYEVVVPVTFAIADAR